MLSNTFFLWQPVFHLLLRRKVARKAPERAPLADHLALPSSLIPLVDICEHAGRGNEPSNARKQAQFPFLFDTRSVRNPYPCGRRITGPIAIGKSYRVIDTEYWTTRFRPPRFFGMKRHADLVWRSARVRRAFKGHIKKDELAVGSLGLSIVTSEPTRSPED